MKFSKINVIIIGSVNGVLAPKAHMLRMSQLTKTLKQKVRKAHEFEEEKKCLSWQTKPVNK